MIKFYLFKANWYDEYEGKEETCQGVVAANDYANATVKMVHRFPNLEQFHIQELDDLDFIFMSDRYYEIFREEGLGALEELESEEAAYTSCGEI